MPAHLEAWLPAGPRLIPLSGERVSVGTADTNDVVLGGDRSISRVHALVERVGGAWSLRDLGSRNGTTVNGERILGDRVLRGGDEIVLGRTRLVFRADGREPTATETAEPPPALTPRERDILLALCRPVLSGNLLTEPASVRQIASEVVLTESAVKKHLVRLYDKFGLHEAGERRRGGLANEAIRRAAITIADLRRPPV